VTSDSYTPESLPCSLFAIVTHQAGHQKGRIYISLFYVQGCVYKAYKSKIHYMNTENVVRTTVVQQNQGFSSSRSVMGLVNEPVEDGDTREEEEKGEEG
jgi:hypothetical protein